MLEEGLVYLSFTKKNKSMLEEFFLTLALQVFRWLSPPESNQPVGLDQPI
jgi:hypothetical protein